MVKKEVVLKYATIYGAYILIVWGFYRLIFKLPDEVEELFVKPVIWLVPILFILKKEGLNLKSLGFNFEKFFPVIYSILGLGAIFVIEALVVNYLKYGGLSFGANIGTLPLMSAMGLSFATAFSEEIAFRGYLFNRVWQISKNEWLANISTNFVWVLIHVPVTFFVLKMAPAPALIYLGITAIFGIGSAFIFARTKNVVASILLHVLWEWPIILFR
jgi:membrane protease YdiL (CAAX protease family)